MGAYLKDDASVLEGMVRILCREWVLFGNAHLLQMVAKGAKEGSGEEERISTILASSLNWSQVLHTLGSEE